MRVFLAGSDREKNDGSGEAFAGSREKRDGDGELKGRRTNDSYFETHKSDLDRWSCQDDILIVKMGRLRDNGAFFRDFSRLTIAVGAGGAGGDSWGGPANERHVK